jgi:hydrogenase maturation factor HypF (carbamoyltransferase family)
LIDNELYEKIFKEIDFPLVSIDAKTEDGKIINTKEMLLQTYGDQISYILESDNTIENPQPREVFQIVYGKVQQIEPKAEVKKDEPYFNVSLDYEQSSIGSYKLKPLKILLNDDKQQTVKHTALSLLFTKLPIEDILELKLTFTSDEIKKLYDNWENSINTFTSNSLITLFDAIATLSGELDEKSFTAESWMAAEAHYEVCEEDLFDYDIVGDEIEIDIISSYLNNNKLKNLGSTLVNTISSIIANIAKEQDLKVRLEGELFYFRDLSELTIEKIEDEDLEVELI